MRVRSVDMRVKSVEEIDRFIADLSKSDFSRRYIFPYKDLTYYLNQQAEIDSINKHSLLVVTFDDDAMMVKNATVLARMLKDEGFKYHESRIASRIRESLKSGFPSYVLGFKQILKYDVNLESDYNMVDDISGRPIPGKAVEVEEKRRIKMEKRIITAFMMDGRVLTGKGNHELKQLIWGPKEFSKKEKRRYDGAITYCKTKPSPKHGILKIVNGDGSGVKVEPYVPPARGYGAVKKKDRPKKYRIGYKTAVQMVDGRVYQSAIRDDLVDMIMPDGDAIAKKKLKHSIGSWIYRNNCGEGFTGSVKYGVHAVKQIKGRMNEIVDVMLEFDPIPGVKAPVVVAPKVEKVYYVPRVRLSPYIYTIALEDGRIIYGSVAKELAIEYLGHDDPDEVMKMIVQFCRMIKRSKPGKRASSKKYGVVHIDKSLAKDVVPGTIDIPPPPVKKIKPIKEPKPPSKAMFVEREDGKIYKTYTWIDMVKLVFPYVYESEYRKYSHLLRNLAYNKVRSKQYKLKRIWVENL